MSNKKENGNELKMNIFNIRTDNISNIYLLQNFILVFTFLLTELKFR